MVHKHRRFSENPHFATFPPALVAPCITAASAKGDIVLDPFFGSGTVGVVCEDLGRRFLGIELNPEYAQIAKKRLAESKALWHET